MSQLKITLRLQERNFGRPSPDEITHLVFTRIPTSRSAEIYSPVTRRECGAHWNNQPSGTSGYYWSFFADVPLELAGLSPWDDDTQAGQYVVTIATT
jgi:hypothetical protein